MKTHASFRGDFPKDHSPEGPAGHELADLLSSKLTEQGFVVRRGETDYSHEMVIHSSGARFNVMVGLVDDGDREWLFFADSCLGWFARILGKRDDHAHRGLLEAVHKLLTEDYRIQDLRWYTPEEWNTAPQGGSTSPAG